MIKNIIINNLQINNIRINNIRFISTFVKRHIGINNKDEECMLKKCNVNSMNQLIEEVTHIPKNKQLKLNLINTYEDEFDAQKNLKDIMNMNKITKCFLGQGYYNCILPFPIKRHILENPKWYTSYTPYQAEISQGRLESQYNYQTVIKELTGLPISNASLLDEASSSAEVINLCYNYYRTKKRTFLYADDMHQQVIDVLKTKAELLDLNLIPLNLDEYKNSKNIEKLKINIKLDDVCGFMFQYPNTFGDIIIPTNLITFLKDTNIIISCSTDLLALTQIKSPKEIGADIAFGNSQRLGVPLWFGGPHPAFFAVDDFLTRYLPGRIIGMSKDTSGNDVYRLGLQTREQHIRRDKATSNICTAQSLLTNVVSMYSMYHGPDGLRDISLNIITKTNYLRENLINLGFEIKNNYFFDTITIDMDNYNLNFIDSIFNSNNIILRKDYKNNYLIISIDETTKNEDVSKIINIFSDLKNKNDIPLFRNKNINNIPKKLKRESEFLQQDVFKMYNTETKLLRYIHKLQEKDYTLCEGMIPLGSCTMKLNSVFELEPLSWENTTNFHPYLPSEYVKGYLKLIDELGNFLKEITNFDAISFQSNSGSMGEYSGLITIKKYFESLGEYNRNICLIPNTAHGTNFASAKMANFKIIVYDDNKLLIDEFEDLVKKKKII